MTVNYTDNYAFILYPTTPGTATFLDFRSDIAGTGAGTNTQKLDGILWDRQIENENRRLYSVPLSANTVGYKETATLYKRGTTPFDAYSTDMRLIFTFPDNMDSANAVVNINSIGQVALQKADPLGGSYIDITKYDVLKKREYLFRYDGTRFVMMDQTDTGYIRKNVEVLSGTKTLTDSDKPFQFLSCEGGTAGDRTVVLPAVTVANPIFYITNTSPTYTITVNNATPTLVGIIRPGNTEVFASSGSSWYLQGVNPENIIKGKGELIVGNANSTPANLATPSNSMFYLGGNTTGGSTYGLEWKQPNHTELLNKGTNTHAQIDTHIGSFPTANQSHVPNATVAGQFYVSSNGTNNMPVALPVGANNSFLVANASNIATGVEWRNYVKVRANTTLTNPSSLSPNWVAYDQYSINALAQHLTVGVPTGTSNSVTPDGQKLVIRIYSAGTYNITWPTVGTAGYYRAIAVDAIPTSTTPLATMYFGFLYNSSANTWDCVAQTTQPVV